jgi:hypothetical protein
MPRSRKGTSARGTRLQSLMSATTFALNPSGVTIDAQGINISGNLISTTELGYLDGAAGYPLAHSALAGYGTTAGMDSWAGTSLNINTGFTTLVAFIPNFVRNDAAAVSPPMGIEQVVASGEVTVGLYTMNPTLATMALYPSGGSIAWFAIGA